MSEPLRIDDPWCRHLPLLHRILAGTVPVEDFPRASADLPLDEACAAWEPLHYLLRQLLGWDDPGLGLAWWYRHGKPTADSALLHTVADIWGRADVLDHYAAWAWTHRLPSFDRAAFSPIELARESLYNDEGWWQALARRPRPRGADPFHGGSNPLHLGHSDCFGNDEPATDAALLNYDPATRRAVLVVNQFRSWRRDLAVAEKHLPSLGDRSWHVELFDRQVGYLGLFRRSRETGRWFQGRHGIHVQGRAPQTAEAEV